MVSKNKKSKVKKNVTHLLIDSNNNEVIDVYNNEVEKELLSYFKPNFDEYSDADCFCDEVKLYKVERIRFKLEVAKVTVKLKQSKRRTNETRTTN